MAKLTSLIRFKGTLDGFTAYQVQGLPDWILRRAGGPSGERIKHDPCFENTRRNNSEFAGRSAATHYIFAAFGTFPRGRDTSGEINQRLTSLQKLDRESSWGQRAVRLSLYPEVLRGLSITGRLTLDPIVPALFACSLSREALSGVVEVPALLPGVNCHHPATYPYFRVAAVLGIVPDLYYDEKFNRFVPVEGFVPMIQKGETPWQPATTAAPATIELQLPQLPATDSITLVLSAGIEYGKLNPVGGVEPARKAVAARVLAVG